MLSSIPLVGGALAGLAGAGGGFGARIRGEMSEMGRMTADAQRLGVSVGTLAGIQLLAGDSADSMVRGMSHLNKEIGEAGSGSEEARAKFVGLGLSFDALASMDPDQRLGAVSDALNKLPSDTDRAAVGFRLFGRTYGEMLPVLAKGSAALENAKVQAKLTGLAFSSLDASNVRRASVALRSIEASVTGVFRQAAIQAAPWIEAIADKWMDIIRGMGGIGPAVRAGFDFVVDGAKIVLRTVGELVEGFKELAASAKDVKEHGFIGAEVNKLADIETKGFIALGYGKSPARRVDEVISRTQKPGTKEYKESIEAYLEMSPKMTDGERNAFLAEIHRMHPQVNVELKTIRNPLQSVINAISAVQEKARKGLDVKVTDHGPTLLAAEAAAGVAKLERELTREIATLGRGSDATKLYDLKVKGATDDQLWNAKSLIKQRDGINAVTSAYANAGTVLEQYSAKMRALQAVELHLNPLEIDRLGKGGLDEAIAEMERKTEAAKKSVSAKTEPLGIAFPGYRTKDLPDLNPALADSLRPSVEKFEGELAALRATRPAEALKLTEPLSDLDVYMGKLRTIRDIAKMVGKEQETALSKKALDIKIQNRSPVENFKASLDELQGLRIKSCVNYCLPLDPVK